LAVHCGNGLMPVSTPFRVNSSRPRQLPYGEGTKKNECRFLDPAWNNASVAGSHEVNVM